MASGRLGRPRSEKSREAVLRAAHELLVVGGGAALSIEAIAKRAEVGKTTIYRWWPTLADIVLEALLRQADEDIPVQDSECLQTTLQEFLRLSTKAVAEGAGVHLRFLMAQAQQDEAFRERFRDRFVAKRRAVLVSILQRAVERGQADSAYDLELMVDLVFGAMWYRLLVGHAPMDEPFAEELTELVMGVIAKRST